MAVKVDSDHIAIGANCSTLVVASRVPLNCSNSNQEKKPCKLIVEAICNWQSAINGFTAFAETSRTDEQTDRNKCVDKKTLGG